MKKTIISKWMKTLVAGALSASLVLAGAMTVPTTAEAAELTVHYAPRSAAAFQAWKDNGTVPTENGYLFGGWYTYNGESEKYNPLRETDRDSYNGEVYAKFVPSYVLSVKTQLDDNTTSAGAGDGQNASLRILTGVDSLQYKNVGADVYLGNVLDAGAQAQTTVYDTLQVGGVDVPAGQLFGSAASYFCAWNIININDVNDESIIYVRPYWVTLDGTKVYGIGKYVHVEDGYLDYISVPVNMMGAQAAAGITTMRYDSSKVSFVGIENGRAFGEMDYRVGNGTVKFVGNSATVDQHNGTEALFANVRFRVNDGVELYTDGDGVRTRNEYLNFSITSADFSNWNAESIDAGVWNVQY